MSHSERSTERIVRLMREAAERDDIKLGRVSGQIIVRGNGNVLGNVHGDMITIHSAPPLSPTRAKRKVLRASAISFIRHTCGRLGDPLRYRAFAIDEFGTAELEQLDETQLERVRGWCAAKLDRAE